MNRLEDIIENCYRDDLYDMVQAEIDLKDLMLKWAVWNHLRIKRCEILGRDCIIDSQIALDEFLKQI